MNMIETNVRGELNYAFLLASNYVIEEIAAVTAAKVSNEYSYFIKKRFSDYFETGTGKLQGSKLKNTVDTIGVYRRSGKGKKKAVFVIRAGLGVRGNLNYLSGLYRGEATSRSGKTFHYYKPRNLITETWRDFGGQKRLSEVFDSIAESRLEIKRLQGNR